MIIENMCFVTNHSERRCSLSLGDMEAIEFFDEDEVDSPMPMLKVIPLDDESSCCHNNNADSTTTSTSLCASVTCVIEQLQRFTLSGSLYNGHHHHHHKSVTSHTTTKNRPNHRRSRNQALTAKQFDTLVLSQLDMTN